MKENAAEILASKKLYIFDMDGTIYLGGIVFDYAIRYIKRLRKEGKRVMFFTNNASRSTSRYVEKLTRLGFEPTPEEIMSSADVTVAFLKTHYPEKKVYLVGTNELYEHFFEAGIPLATGDEDNVDIVITSFDTELTYKKLDDACRLIRNGAVYLCTHPDFNCPTETGFMPDSGAIAALVTASTNVTPRYLGKPYPEVVDMIEKVTGIDRADMCIFGDRLYTDIALGAHNGVCSVLVLSGESTLDDVEKLDDGDRPDFVFPSLDEVDKLMFGY